MSLVIALFEGKFGEPGFRLLASLEEKGMAGPEAFRDELWGKQVLQTLGLQMLPSMAKNYLVVNNDHLDQLSAELSLMEANLNLIVGEDWVFKENVSEIISNIIQATTRAHELSCGIVIW